MNMSRSTPNVAVSSIVDCLYPNVVGMPGLKSVRIRSGGDIVTAEIPVAVVDRSAVAIPTGGKVMNS